MTTQAAKRLSKTRTVAVRAANSPKTRKVLLVAIRSERARLMETISGLSDAERIEPGVVGDWSIKDILAHLTAWEQRLVQRVTRLPEPGLDLGTPAFNEQVYRENQARPLAAVQSESEQSYAAVLQQAEGLTSAEINQWWRSFGLNTYNHYRWARRHIRRWAKSLG